jgi:hypothetical protein
MTVLPRGQLPEQIDHIDGEPRRPADVLDGARPMTFLTGPGSISPALIY